MDFYGTEPEEAAPVFDDSLDKIHRQRSFAVTAIAIVGVAGACWLIYSLYSIMAKDPQDEQMLAAAHLIEKAVTYYYADHADYPTSLDQVEQYIPRSRRIPSKEGWPVEPYNGEQIQETGSPEFSGPDSVGMVHYEKIEGGDKTGYRLYVFGRDGLLKVLWGGFVMEQ